jgi:hypothetical protein
MPTLRERASDTLLRTGTENAIDRAELTRALSAVPPSARGHLEASGAMAVAEWVDAAVLWVAWRLRPRRMTL